jgi:hypothetical protein
MDFVQCLQIIDDARSAEEAARLLGYQATQAGFLAGRVLPPESGKPWRAQTFHDSGDLALGGWAPDGSRVVLVPPSLLDACQIVLVAGSGACGNPLALTADA